MLLVLMALLGSGGAWAQENPLSNVHTPAPPPPPKTEEEKKPLVEGAANVAANATSRRDARIRVDVNLVLVPMTVTDPMNRLVTGLERDNFQIFENNQGQSIKQLLDAGCAGDDRDRVRPEREHVVEVHAGAEGAQRVSANVESAG